MYTHQKQIVISGTPIAQAKGALIMIHGRGGTAPNIASSLATELNVAQLAIFAPQATNNSWYPYSFMAPAAQNQPALDSAIKLIGELVADTIAAGVAASEIFFLGFSQGACLTLEYIARNAQRYGGAVAFTGGLIGQELNIANYQGNFSGTPVLVTTGNPDPHVPLSRVEESVAQLKSMGASVSSKVYPGRPHTILQEEIDFANQLIFTV